MMRKQKTQRVLERLFLTAILLLLALPSESFAQAASLADVGVDLVEQTQSIPNLYWAAAYVLGFGFTIAGLIKMRDYVDSPADSPMKDALVRLAVGAALLITPFIVNISAGTYGGVQSEFYEVQALGY